MSDIELEPHDPAWRELFEAERERIRNRAGDDALGIYHIGSTAVPGLAAKPRIDILAIYATPAALHDAKDDLLDDYRIHRDENERVVLMRSVDSHGFNLHLRPRTVQEWWDQLVFRELLRENPQAREKYEKAKRDAEATYPNDGKAYTAAKESVVHSLTERAYEAGYDECLLEFVEKD